MKIVFYPDEGLNHPCEQVNEFNSSLISLINDMAKTMYEEKGVGLAAPQVGVNKRVLVMDPTCGESPDQLRALINPKITWYSQDKVVAKEGCLSIPGVIVNVPRSCAIDVEYHDTNGQMRNTTFTGFSARIIQHEIDHLDGVLMLKHVYNQTQTLW